MLISGVPEVKVPLSMATLPETPALALPEVMAMAPVEVVPVPVDIVWAPEAPAEALPVVAVRAPVAAAARVLMVKAEAVVSPDWIVRVPAVVFQVELPLVAVRLSEVAPVIARALAAVDQVAASAEVRVRAPAEVLQVEAAPAVMVKAEAPVLKDEAPAEVEPIAMVSAPVEPIVMASMPAATVPAMLMV